MWRQSVDTLTDEELFHEAQRLLSLQEDLRARKGQPRWHTVSEMRLRLDPAYRTAPHLDLLSTLLTDMFVGNLFDFLLVTMPPQEGKSQTVSVALPKWLLSWDPTLKIALVSHAFDLALEFSQAARIQVEHEADTLHVDLDPSWQRQHDWRTRAGGGVRAVGIGGSITGRPVDVEVVDDPVGSRADAESPTLRNRNWGWWESDGSTRLSGRRKVIVLMTRWHEDDLGGRLIKREPGRWKVVNIPAIAEDADPLGRQPGEELRSIRDRAPNYFHDLEKIRSPYVFRGMYQGHPSADKGTLFRRDAWQYWEPGDQSGQVKVGAQNIWGYDLWRYAVVDLAASVKTAADWTVCTVFGLTPNGDLLVLDRQRQRLEETDHAAMVLPMCNRWKVDAAHVEKGFIGSTLVIDLTKAGVPVIPVDPETDKVTRAIPATNRQHAGRIFLPRWADWLDEWMDEHAEFPNGAHDDQVDTLAYGVRVAAARWNPVGATAHTGGNGHREGLDLERQAW